MQLQYAAREAHSDLIMKAHSIRYAKELAASPEQRTDKPARERLATTSAIMGKLALRRVAELPTLDVGRKSAADKIPGGAMRSASRRSAARKERSSPYAKKKSPKTKVRANPPAPTTVSPGPATTGLSSDIRQLGLGFPTASPTRRKPRKLAALPVVPSSVIHISGCEAMRGCGGARGPIERLACSEESAQRRYQAQERERRQEVRDWASQWGQQQQQQRHDEMHPNKDTRAASVAFDPSSSLARSTSSSLAKQPTLNHRLPSLPKQHGRREIRFKSGFEGLLDMPSPTSPVVARSRASW